MNNKKIRLTESELKQVVEAAVRKILVKEGFGDWASDKFDNAFRGYKVREGNPQSVLDVIKSDGWAYDEKTKFRPTKNTFIVKKVTGAWGEHYGLSIEELIDDINIFLDGKGEAFFNRQVNPHWYEITVNGPMVKSLKEGYHDKFLEKRAKEQLYRQARLNDTSAIDNASSVLDVIKNNEWIYNKENPIDPTTNTIRIKKRYMGFGFDFRFPLLKLISDINKFLNGKGEASLVEPLHSHYEFDIKIDAPDNLIKGNDLA